MLQVAEIDTTLWRQTYVYGAGFERISMNYVPAYDHDNGWEPSPGEGGAQPGTTPKTLYFLADGLGSTLGLLTYDGRISARYDYDEFGIVQSTKKFDINWPGPDNMYGYTGLEYEYYTDLNYARARYYKAEIGRFISEDSYLGNVWNPQTLNLYTYVHNNPLRYIDPSGHAVWLVHGTFQSEEKGTGCSKKFIDYIEDLFNEEVFRGNWSGKNTTGARSEGAELLADQIYKYHLSNKNEPIRIIGFSHGGNVGILATNTLADKGVPVETLVTLGTPIRGYKLETDVGQHINIYNKGDGGQKFGGSPWTLWTAKRKYDGAENVEIDTPYNWNNWFDNHMYMQNSIEMWKKYIELLLMETTYYFDGYKVEPY